MTHIRAFLKVDTNLKLLTLKAAVELKKSWASRCTVQICVYAPQAVCSDTEGAVTRQIVDEATSIDGVEALASAPSTEATRSQQIANVEWVLELGIRTKKHVDIHLDAHLDAATPPLVFDVLDRLKTKGWVERNPGKTVCLRHCARLALFSESEWRRLRVEVGDLPVWFVGLPMSERAGLAQGDDGGMRPMPVLWMAKALGFNVALGVEHVGNAIAPSGRADPLSGASVAAGLYHARTEEDARILYVSLDSPGAEVPVREKGRRADGGEYRSVFRPGPKRRSDTAGVERSKRERRRI